MRRSASNPLRFTSASVAKGGQRLRRSIWGARLWLACALLTHGGVASAQAGDPAVPSDETPDAGQVATNPGAATPAAAPATPAPAAVPSTSAAPSSSVAPAPSPAAGAAPAAPTPMPAPAPTAAT